MSTTVINPKMKRRMQKAELSKVACGLKTFLSEKAADNWKAAMRGDFSGNLKGIDPKDRVKQIMGMTMKELHAEGNEKARAFRYLIDAYNIHEDLGTAKMWDNTVVMEMLRKNATTKAALSDLITRPDIVYQMPDLGAWVTDNDWDANWMLFYAMTDSSNPREAKGYEFLYNAMWKELGEHGKIEVIDIGGDDVDTVKTKFYGGGYNFALDLFDHNANNLNIAIAGLRMANEAKKSEVAWAAISDASSFTATVTPAAAPSTTIADRAVALNEAGFTLINRFSPSSTKLFRATPQENLLLACNFGTNATEWDTALKLRMSEGTQTTETVMHNITLVVSQEVPVQPDASNNGAVLRIAGRKVKFVTFGGIMFDVTEEFDTNGKSVKGRAKWRAVNQDADQAIFVRNDG